MVWMFANMNFGIGVLDELLCKLCGVSSLKIIIVFITMRISSLVKIFMKHSDLNLSYNISVYTFPY